MTRRHSPGRRPLDEDGRSRVRSPRSLSDLRDQRDRDAERRRRRERIYRNALLVGLAVSVIVHLALVAVLSSQLRLPRMATDGRPAAPAEDLDAQRVVQVREPEAEVPPRPEQAVEPPPPPVREEATEEEEEAPEPEGEPVPAEEERAGEAERADEGMTNADRLEPKEGDARLWRKFWDENPDRYLGGSARADSAIRAILGKYFDSLRLAREAYDEARDWTVGEGEDRWGVSSEGIHLGDVTIPLPVNQLLSPTGPKRRELERELRELRQIQRQETLRQAEETREERIEEMRERSREKADSDSTESDDEG